jgi:Amt family ammonium transporter
MLGAGLLWFGWFGFNAGSALAANENAALALVNTHVAAGAAALSWAIVEWLKQGKPTALGVASGLVAGLVVITPAAGFVGPISAVMMGLAAGAVCYGAVMLKGKLGYDDALDAFGIHGVGGALGAILTGVFAAEVWGGAQGLVDGSSALVLENAIGVLAAATYSVVVTFVILKVIDATIGLRVSSDEESEGLDANLHGEEGYHMGGAGALIE